MMENKKVMKNVALFFEYATAWTLSRDRWRTVLAVIALQLMLHLPFDSEIRAAEGDAGNATCINDYAQCFKEMLPIQEMHATAYTKAFAERFGLEPPAPGTEPTNGLEALELRVERTAEWTKLYSFTLYLYIDSRLPVKLPGSGTAGYKRMLLDTYHFFGDRHKGQWMKWPVEDRRYLSKLNGGYNMKAFLATMDYVPNKKGAIDSIEYDEFHQELLPGLTYVRLSFSGALILGKPYKDVGIFLQRTTETEYREKIYIEPGEFLKFRIPDHIYAKLKEWKDKIRGVNEMIYEKERKREKGADQQ